MKTFPSIFNDVLGPVMRGPSSSHSAAALRIGRMARDLMAGELDKGVVDYAPNGSLVTTHESQGSDLGLFGGLMGWETDDARLPNFREEITRAGIDVEIRYLWSGPPQHLSTQPEEFPWRAGHESDIHGRGNDRDPGDQRNNGEYARGLF